MFDWDIFALGGKIELEHSLIRQIGSLVHMGAMTQPPCLRLVQVFPCASNFSPVHSPLYPQGT